MDLTIWLAEVSRTALPLWDIVLRLLVAALLALAVGWLERRTMNGAGKSAEKTTGKSK